VNLAVALGIGNLGVLRPHYCLFGVRVSRTSETLVAHHLTRDIRYPSLFALTLRSTLEAMLPGSIAPPRLGEAVGEEKRKRKPTSKAERAGAGER